MAERQTSSYDKQCLAGNHSKIKPNYFLTFKLYITKPINANKKENKIERNKWRNFMFL